MPDALSVKLARAGRITHEGERLQHTLDAMRPQTLSPGCVGA